MLWLNDKEVDIKKFPNHETYVSKADLIIPLRVSPAKLTLRYEDDSDLIELMFAKRYLDDLGHGVTLEVLYMPYSRLDRDQDDFIFTLKYVCEFINGLKFEKVTVLEPHSDVAIQLLDNAEARFLTVDLVEIAAGSVGFDDTKDYLFFPDKGAKQRYGGMFPKYKQLHGEKERDFATGHITKLDIVGDKPTPGFKAIIVDDLCSKGGTFVLSAERLREAGASEVYLVVAHCEETIFRGKLPYSDSPINGIYATNSIINDTNDSFAALFKNRIHITKLI